MKIGDKVRVLDGSNIPDYIGGWDRWMNRLIGCVYTIDHFERDGRIVLKDCCFKFDPRGLELVDDVPDSSNNLDEPRTVTITEKDLISAQAEAMAKVVTACPALTIFTNEIATISALTVCSLFEKKEREEDEK